MATVPVERSTAPETKKHVPPQPVDLLQYMSPTKSPLLDISDDTTVSEREVAAEDASEGVVHEHAGAMSEPETKVVADSELETDEAGEEYGDEGSPDPMAEPARQVERYLQQNTLGGASDIFCPKYGLWMVCYKTSMYGLRN